jgi:hypothetical protein
MDLNEATMTSVEPPSAGIRPQQTFEPASGVRLKQISEKGRDMDSQSKISGYRSGMSKKRKPLPFNALRFIA